MPQAMADAVAWLTEFERFWTTSFDWLDGMFVQMKHAEAKEAGHE